MSDKSYVTLEQKQCPVCGTVFDTGNLLMDNRMQKSFDKYTVTGFGLCPKCGEIAKKGFVFLVEATLEPDQNKKSKNKKLKQVIPVPTGRIARIKKSVAEQMFNVKVEDLGFMEPEAFEKLQMIGGEEVDQSELWEVTD